MHGSLLSRCSSWSICSGGQSLLYTGCKSAFATGAWWVGWPRACVCVMLARAHKRCAAMPCRRARTLQCLLPFCTWRCAHIEDAWRAASGGKQVRAVSAAVCRALAVSGWQQAGGSCRQRTWHLSQNRGASWPSTHAVSAGSVALQHHGSKQQQSKRRAWPMRRGSTYTACC